MISKFFKWSILSAVFSVGFFGLLILAGDDDPYNPMPIGRWLLLKAVGAALIAASVYVGKVLDRHDLLPENFHDLDEEEEL